MLLLDTQALVWSRFGDTRLGREAREQIEMAVHTGNTAVSAITFWEIGMLVQRGRITLLEDLAAWLSLLLRDGLVELPVDGALGVRAGSLADIGGDPADRIIVATAMNGHTLVTSDRALPAWPGQVERLDARR